MERLMKNYVDADPFGLVMSAKKRSSAIPFDTLFFGSSGNRVGDFESF